MSTGAQHTAITAKRILGTQDFGSRFLDYLATRDQENFGRIYNASGVYNTKLTAFGDGADSFSINGTSQSTDGIGNLLDISNLTEKTGIQFENSLGVWYYVGLKYASRPVDVAINPRTGMPDYTHYEDYIGNSDDPDSVVDNGTNLTFVVDSITEAGHSNAGREVMVFLKVPAENGTSAAIAIETATVVWTGSQNEITTSGLLGQSTPSTTSADYTVILLGPVVSTADISGDAGICFLGLIQGAGAGNTPSISTNAAQNLIVGTLSNLNEVLRVEPSNGRLKVDVVASGTEVGIDQIRVTKTGTGVVFSVDENGNVTIEGDLNVTGTTTQEDIVTVNSSETITDNLTAGDANADSHNIKGTWSHRDQAESTYYFYINGSTGRIGIGSVDNGTHALTVTGDLSVTGDADLTNLNVATAVQSNLIPTGAVDLGSSGSPWTELYASTGFVDALDSVLGSGITLADSIDANADDAYDLGDAVNMFGAVYTHDLVLDNTPGRGVGSDLAPQADNTYDIGTATRRWGTIYANDVNFAGDFLPEVNDTQDLGSPSLRWVYGYFSGKIDIDGNGPTGTDHQAINVNSDFSAPLASDANGIVSIDALWVGSAAVDPVVLRVAGAYSSSTVDSLTISEIVGNVSGTGTTGTLTLMRCSGTVFVSYTVQNWIGIHIDPTVFGTIGTSVVGLQIEDVDGGPTNYSIRTNNGLVQFGDTVQPETDSSIDLGTSSLYWQALYADNIFTNLPTSDPAVAGQLWNDTGTVKVSAG